MIMKIVFACFPDENIPLTIRDGDSIESKNTFFQNIRFFQRHFSG